MVVRMRLSLDGFISIGKVTETLMKHGTVVLQLGIVNDSMPSIGYEIYRPARLE